ncbi:MAG: NifU family protein [Bacteroidales bacterium]|nr:NifU family protein [Bacteroidales bacterium]
MENKNFVLLQSKKKVMETPTLEQKVKSIISQIRPYLQQDGGDIEFIELTADNVVKVKLQGACGTCPHAKMTLKNGVEQTLKKYLPEVDHVEDIILGF